MQGSRQRQQQQQQLLSPGKVKPVQRNKQTDKEQTKLVVEVRVEDPKCVSCVLLLPISIQIRYHHDVACLLIVWIVVEKVIHADDVGVLRIRQIPFVAPHNLNAFSSSVHFREFFFICDDVGWSEADQFFFRWVGCYLCRS